MSESTSDTGQANVSDDPSMEDILASIRKIISDDDTVATVSEPQAVMAEAQEDFSGLEALLNEAEADERGISDKRIESLEAELSQEIELMESPNEPSIVLSLEDHDMSSSDDDIDAELEGLMSDLEDIAMAEDLDQVLSFEPEDNDASDIDLAEAFLSDNLVDTQNELRSDPIEETPVSAGGVTEESDVVDLDIETLLGDVEAASDIELEAIDNLLDDIDLTDETLTAIEIPEMEKDLTVTDDIATDDLDMLLNEAPEDQSDDAALFNELEGLLDNSQDDDLALLDDLVSGDETLDIEDAVSLEDNSISDEANIDLGLLMEDDGEDLSVLLESLVVEPEEMETSLEDLISVSETDIEEALDKASLDVDPQVSEMTGTETLDATTLDATLFESEIPVDEALVAEEPEDSDITLVKSLMADLTDPDVDIMDELEAVSFEEEIFVDETSLETEAFSENETSSDRESSPDIIVTDNTSDLDLLQADNVETTEDILEDILSASLEDEIATHDQDLESFLAIPEQEIETEHLLDEADHKATEIIAETPQPTLESVIADEAENLAQSEAAEESRSSLMDIAMEAEQEASEAEAALENKTNETPQNTPVLTPATRIGTTGFGALVLGASALGAAKIGSNLSVSHEEVSPSNTDLDTLSPNSVLEVSMDETETETHLDSHETALTQEPMEIDTMPKAAANSDTILDEVSKEASASAFASLNQMVEEKAIVAERGDRIGDLVMEALRPMLKEWLDDNLQDIVERAVTKEVKRIASGD